MPSDQPESAPLLLHVFSTFAVGGAQIRFITLANHFGPAWRHRIIATDGNYAGRDRLASQVNANCMQVEMRKGDTLGNVRRFRRVLRTVRPDMLITYNWGTIEWAFANALPLVPHLHIEDGFGPEEQSAQLPRRVWLRRLFLRRATVMVPSRTLYRIATEVWRLPRKHVLYVPNGIDLDRYGADASGSPDWPGEGPVIGTVATLRPEKNLPRLLRAVQLLRTRMPVRLVIVGDGSERSSLEELAQTLGIAEAVHFTGYCATPNMMYRGFDVFALTSDTEQMPLSVLEAMASGLAVVATDVGDVRDMVAEANLQFIVPRDEAALAGAMERLLQQPDLRAAIGTANRAKAERDYDEDRMFRAHEALWSGRATPDDQAPQRAT
ncbi:MAG TPA: glycosyltransferase family 4 protein [Acetobacteraceae bacterium]|nr:glycosyltransferase family 4 protein [Acetobacteraceae bacterium]